jgi:CRISPR-associated protein Cmr3
MTTVYVLDPFDTLLFRDGRPFEQSDEGLVEAISMFPPFPTVTAGAFRASVARQLGWDGSERWGNVPAGDRQCLTDLLGSGPFTAGQLRFGPPLPMSRRTTRKSGDQEYEWLLPCPAALYGHFPEPGGDDWRDDKANDYPTKLAVAKPTQSDAFQWASHPSHQSTSRSTLLVSGSDGIVIPATEQAAYKSLDGWFIPLRRMRAFLKGEELSSGELTPKPRIGRPQRRVGIQRDLGRNIVKQGKLYAASHERLGGHSGTGQAEEFALGLSVRSKDSGFRPEPQERLQLGSHGRSVECSAVRTGDDWDGVGFFACETDELTDDEGAVYFSVVLLSPALFGEDENGTPRHLAGEHGLPGDLISAVVPKPLTFGGWDARKSAPAPMRRYFAAGSTFYFQTNDDVGSVYKRLDEISRHGIGRHTEVGLGAVAIGTWRFAETGGSGT